MARFYFENIDSEHCYSKEELLKMYGKSLMDVFKAVPKKINGIFYCQFYGEIGEKELGVCGRECNGYTPKNKKSGCCIHYRKTLYVPGDKTTIRSLSQSL